MSTGPRVFVPNLNFHDFRDAERFGELVFLSQGQIDRTKVGALFGQMSEKMRDSTEQDYLLVSSIGLLNAIAASILAVKHGSLRLLIYDNGTYQVREINLDAVHQDAA